ncbi:CDP-glycerol glycerophosphotransferase family protein [Amnibacterium sp. CER49]|uniref:CDP-glycerol glycerophosphotransferase family protein n=1 Tax=Amnibacterium sp. CER49 TaxID=3039161 RepID=UPI00244D3D93|nr:CDP-glycerol glycerophosphotransferase family protein [Amnibacterium sp. CER49]MDH2443079.1 CDP-glycerol glycerophosphotransferase family protein [Amnibacterium sp. CER49]
MPAARPRSVGSIPDQSDLIDLALVALAAVGALVALVTGAALVAVVAALPSLAADVVRVVRPPSLRSVARRLLLDRASRSLVRNGAVVVAVAGTARTFDGVPTGDLVALLFAVMGVHGALTLSGALRTRRLEVESTTILWRGLDVAGALDGPDPLPDPVRRLLPIDGRRLLSLLEVLVLAGLLLAAARVPALPVVAAALVVVGAGAVMLAVWRGWGRGPVRDTDSLVEAAVAQLAPEVVFYFSSPASGTYALTVWASVINAVRRPVLVLVREAVHLEQLDAITAPMVVAPYVADLLKVVPPSVRVVLYPTNVVRNNEMVRIAGPMHCFIGHGDSDKVGSFSPLNRLYDEIWVAGRAAVDRYAAVDEGIDLAAIRAVGRPQLADIARARPRQETDRLTVLYAPTWEGFFDEADYSSVAAMGERIVQGALDSGAAVLFKPHPLTGHRIKEAAAARKAIEELVTRAGNGSRVVENRPDALYGAFNEADVLVSDISSVITDFLASRKPYMVTNRRDVPDAEFRAAFPSASAAELLGSDLAGLPRALAEAAGPDPLRPRREALAEYLLGAEQDPMAAFLREIDDFVARADARAALSPVPIGLRR